MEVVAKLELEEGHEYVLNAAGEVLKIDGKVEKVGEVWLDERLEYYLKPTGEVVSFGRVDMSLEEYDFLLKKGEIGKLKASGERVRITFPEELEDSDVNGVEVRLRPYHIEEIAVKKDFGDHYLLLVLKDGRVLRIKGNVMLGGEDVEVL